MSILIKGMEMPEEGYLIVRIYASGQVCESTECTSVWGKVATAVPVPPHGRLIDAEVLSQGIKDGPGTDMQKFFADVCIATVPTIIPAEEDK